MAGRHNFAGRIKNRLNKASENLTKRVSAAKPESYDAETHKRKVELAKKELEVVKARLANLN